jgi:hypothetical protein
MSKKKIFRILSWFFREIALILQMVWGGWRAGGANMHQTATK